MGPPGARPRLGPGCRRPSGREGRGGAPTHKMAKAGGGAGHCARSRPRGGDWEGAPPAGAARPRGAAPLSPAARPRPRRDPLPAVLAASVGSRNPGTKWRNLIWPFGVIDAQITSLSLCLSLSLCVFCVSFFSPAPLAHFFRPSVSAARTFSLGPLPKRSHRRHQPLQR